MGKKILLADDSITIQKVIELTFSDEDFEVVTVGNGRLAVEKVQEVRPDVVLCDIIMPEKDGYEVCEFIKKNPGLAHVPVLLLTGAFEPFDQERAARAGCDGFLAKPFEPQTLIAKVKDLLSQAAARPQPAAPAAPPAPAPFAPSPAAFAPAPAVPPPPAPFMVAPAAAPFPTPAPPPAPAPEPVMTYLSEEAAVEEAPLGFADVMDTGPAEDALEEPALDPATFGSPVEAAPPDEDLLAVTPEEQAALAAPPLAAAPVPPTDSASTVMFQAGLPPWPTPAPVEEPLEEQPSPSATAAGEASMFEEVFEEDLSSVAPLQAVPPPPSLASEPFAARPAPEPEPVPAPEPMLSTPPATEPEESFADLADEPPAPSAAAEVAVPVEQVAQIAQRVVGQISEKVIREIAWEVIPDLAEALIRKEIERLKAELQQG
jgi:CheY-like chemotaxis protein